MSRSPYPDAQRNRSKGNFSSLLPPGGFAVVSQPTVANGMTEAVNPPFRQRLHQVERAPGFVRLDVLGPLVYSSPAKPVLVDRSDQR